MTHGQTIESFQELARLSVEQPDGKHIKMMAPSFLRPSPENDDVYSNLSKDDPEIIELAKSIKAHGVQEPIIISRDGYVISGHRRRFAAMLVSQTDGIPVMMHPISREENKDEFLKLLVAMNSQRVKSMSIIVRESAIKIDPKVAYQQIVNDRKEKDQQENSLSEIDPYSNGRRCEISDNSYPLLNAIIRVLNEQREYWPISARQIHYRLLGPDAPLKHAKKPNSKYVNDDKSYKKLISVLTRGRTEGSIPWECVEDETRPVDVNEGFWNPGEFFRQQFKNFLKGYWRHKQQSQ